MNFVLNILIKSRHLLSEFESLDQL